MEFPLVSLQAAADRGLSRLAARRCPLLPRDGDSGRQRSHGGGGSGDDARRRGGRRRRGGGEDGAGHHQPVPARVRDGVGVCRGDVPENLPPVVVVSWAGSI